MSPDAKKIAMIFRRENARNGQNRAEIAVVDMATGALRPVTHNNAPEQNVQWSPEGKVLSYLAPSDTSWDLAEDKLWVVPAEGGGEPRQLNASFDAAIGQYTWAADGQSILFGANSRARSAAFRMSVANGAVTKVSSGDWSGRMESVSADGKRGVAVISTPNAPVEVHLIDLTTGKATPITRANAKAAELAVAAVQGDHVEEQGWPRRRRVAVAAGGYKAGAKLPLLLSVHGGPAGAWDLSFRGINHVYTSARLGGARAERARQQLLRRRAPARQHEGHRRRRLPRPDERRRQADRRRHRRSGSPRDPRLELRRHPRRWTHHTNFTIQGGVAGGHGLRLGV